MEPTVGDLQDRSAIYLSPVAYVEDRHNSRGVIDPVNHPIVAHAQPPTLPASKFFRVSGTRIILKLANSLDDFFATGIFN